MALRISAVTFTLAYSPLTVVCTFTLAYTANHTIYFAPRPGARPPSAANSAALGSPAHASICQIRLGTGCVRGTLSSGFGTRWLKTWSEAPITHSRARWIFSSRAMSVYLAFSLPCGHGIEWVWELSVGLAGLGLQHEVKQCVSRRQVSSNRI